MFQHILLATDGSENAHKAENYAMQLNASCGAKLTVVHVLDDKLCHYGKVDTLAPLEARESFISYVIEEQQEASQEILEELNTKAKNTGASFDFKLKQGVPLEQIALTAKEENVDLIIIGAQRSRKSRGIRTLNFTDKLSAQTPHSILSII